MKNLRIFNNKILFVIIIFTVISYNLQAQINSSNNTKIDSVHNSINLSMSIRIGKEIGFNAGIEYESSNWGKLIFRPELSYIGSQKYLLSGAILDFAIGYGYPVLKKKSHTLFINAYLTWYYSGLFTWADGQSAIIELEYRKKGKKRCFVIAPFFRYAATNQFISTYRAFDYSFGVRFGLLRQYSLK